MHPVILRIGPITIYSYGVMIALAFLVSTILCLREAEALKIKRDVILDLSFLIMIFGIIGARAGHVLLNLEEYLHFPLEALKIHRGGLVLYGGMAGGLISGLIYLKRKKLPVLKTTDLVFSFIPLGESIARIGCFLNGCCYGKASKFGIYFPVHGKTLIPTQLYSSLGNLLIFLILRRAYRKKSFDGQVTLLYFFLYPLMRFFIDFFRADSKILFLNLTLLQILNLFILIISIMIYTCKRLSSV